MDKTKSQNTSLNFYDRRRLYFELMQSIKNVKLEPYEDATIMARTILDAASEEDNAIAITKPHIAIVLREGGRVTLTKSGNESVCTVEMMGRLKESGRYTKTFVGSGRSSVSDPDGSTYSAGKAALGYVTALFDEFAKNKNE